MRLVAICLLSLAGCVSTPKVGPMVQNRTVEELRALSAAHQARILQTHDEWIAWYEKGGYPHQSWGAARDAMASHQRDRAKVLEAMGRNREAQETLANSKATAERARSDIEQERAAVSNVGAVAMSGLGGVAQQRQATQLQREQANQDAARRQQQALASEQLRAQQTDAGTPNPTRQSPTLSSPNAPREYSDGRALTDDRQTAQPANHCVGAVEGKNGGAIGVRNNCSFPIQVRYCHTRMPANNLAPGIRENVEKTMLCQNEGWLSGGVLEPGQRSVNGLVAFPDLQVFACQKPFAIDPFRAAFRFDGQKLQGRCVLDHVLWGRDQSPTGTKQGQR